MDLKGRVAIVTGCGHPGQVGRAVAAALRQAGARLAVTARHPQQVADARAELGAGVFGQAADLTDEASTQHLVQVVRAELGPIEILVHCAGGAAPGRPAP